MKRAILLILFALWTFCSSTMAFVQMCITTRKGFIYNYLLTEKPVVTFEKGHLHVETQNVSVDYLQDYDYEDVISITFEEVEDFAVGIDETETDKPREVGFQYVDGRTVRLSGLSEDEHITVYSIDGKRIPARIERSGSTAVLLLERYPSGMYIIKTLTQTFKIHKK